MGKDLSQDLFAAIETIAGEQLKALNFNKTVRCCITNIDKAESGEYTVNDGVNTFTAYSENTSYKINNYVYVLIPNGDYTQQKTILGKYVTTDSTNYTYVKPTDTFVNITGNLLSDIKEDNIFAMTANGDISEIVIAEKEVIEKGYDRLVLKGSFRTWLSKYRLIRGTYGLRLDIIEVVPVTLTSTQKKYHSFILSNADMYGDSYNFETFYEQEAIFDISAFKNIKRMRLVLFQNGDFESQTGLIEKLDVPNLFMRMPEISLGYDLNNFIEDKVLLYSFDSNTYSESFTEKMKQELGVTDEALSDEVRQGFIDDYNSKDIKMRWVRSNPDADVNIGEQKIVAVNETKDIPENTVIHWYRYSLDQGVSDDLAGAFWEEIIENKNSLELKSFLPDVKKQTERIKVIIENPSSEYLASLADKDEVIMQYLAQLNSNDLSDQEREDINVLYENALDAYIGTRNLYESEIYELENEIQVPDYASLDLIKGLDLEIDMMGYQGVYKIYDESGEITASSESSKKRILTANYSSLVSGNQDLDTAEKITWIIPTTNTMIFMPAEGVEYDSDYDEVVTYSDHIEISRYGVAPTSAPGSEEVDSTQQYFRIKTHYSQTATNNTIICRLTKNNRIYEASAILNFGVTGTEGTDYTFVLEFSNNETALTVGEDTAAIVNPIIFDADNNDVTDDFTNFEYSWYSKNDKDGIIIVESSDGQNYCGLRVVAEKMEDAKYYILQCSVSGQVTLAGNAKELTLIAYLPIPIKEKGYPYISIDGATGIRYNNSGTSPKFYNNPYRILDFITTDLTQYAEKEGVCWRMSFGSDCSDASAANGKSFYPDVSYDGKLTAPSLFLDGVGKQIAVDGLYGTPIYKEEPIYQEKTGYYMDVDGTEKPYTYQEQVGTKKVFDHLEDEFLLWSQPLRIYIDTYGSALINSWNGDLTIDENNGIILSAMMGAGIKEKDNSFSGVLIGDVADKTGEREDDYYAGIGVFGYDHGVKTFGLNRTGKAFFGRSGKGQILIDGNEGVIQSSHYKNSSEGLHINLDDGIIISKGPHFKEDEWSEKTTQAEIKIDPTVKATDNSGAFFSITNEYGNKILYAGPKIYYLQSNNYSAKDKIGTKFDITNGTITSYDSKGNGSFVKLSGNADDVFFEIYDAAGKQPIFMAKGGEQLIETSEQEMKNTEALSFNTNAEVEAFINSELAMTGSTTESVDAGCKLIYGPYIADDGSCELVFRTGTNYKVTYKGSSAKYPVSTNNPRQSGDIIDSSCVIQVSYLQNTDHTIRIPRFTKINAREDRHKGFVFDTSLPYNEIITFEEVDLIQDMMKNKDFSDYEINAKTYVDAYHVVETVKYKTYFIETDIANGTYYLQSCNYNGKNTGMNLNISKGDFITYSENASFVRIKGSNNPLFSIWDGIAKKYLMYVADGEYDNNTDMNEDTTYENGSYYLQSSNYSSSGYNWETNSITSGKGMRINLKNGTFITYDKDGTGGYVKIAGNNSCYFKVNNGNKDLIHIGGEGFYLQSADYDGMTSGIKINLSSRNGNGDPSIRAYNFQIKAYKSGTDQSNYINIDSDDESQPFKIHSNTGYIYLGWDGTIKTPVFQVNSDGSMEVGTSFSVSSEGHLKATAGTIGSWKIEERYLESTNGKIILDAATGYITCSNGDNDELFNANTSTGIFKIGPWRFDKDKFWADNGDDTNGTLLKPGGEFKFFTEESSFILSSSSIFIGFEHTFNEGSPGYGGMGEETSTSTRLRLSAASAYLGSGSCAFRVSSWTGNEGSANEVKMFSPNGIVEVNSTYTAICGGGNTFIGARSYGVFCDDYAKIEFLDNYMYISSDGISFSGNVDIGGDTVATKNYVDTAIAVALASL